MCNQTNIGNVSRATLGRLLRDGVKHAQHFPSTSMSSRVKSGNWYGETIAITINDIMNNLLWNTK